MEKLKELTIDRLKNLANDQKQIAFAYSVCYRMLPNYYPFFKKEKWGNTDCLTEALKEIEEFILTGNDRVEKSILLQTIYKNIPDSDEFPSTSASYAQRAASAIYYTLNNIKSVNIEELAWVFILSAETVDLYIQDDNDTLSKKSDHETDLMVREIKKQEFDYLLLLEAKEVSALILSKLLNFNSGKSNIDTPQPSLSL